MFEAAALTNDGTNNEERGVRPPLGPIGVWAHESNLPDDLATELEQLGYSALWLGGSPGGALTEADRLLQATDSMVVATGITNIWKDSATVIAASHRAITTAYPGRFLLGIGTGHPEATSDYQRPYQAMVDYLDVLDSEGVPKEERALAALGPKVLRLARDRSAGAHPYLVTPEHTRQARAILGDGVLLAPEQKVIVSTDPEQARALARPVVKLYLGLTNYVSNLRRLGFTEDDVQVPGTDRLIDALVAHGSAATVAERIRQHLAAGADHVPIQLITAKGEDPLTAYQALAAALI